MEAKSARVSIPEVDDCRCSRIASLGGVPVELTVRLCGVPFAGGDGIGIRACCVPFSNEGSDGVKVFGKGDKPTLGVVEALDFRGLFGDAFATGGVASRTVDSCGESNALISIFSNCNESFSYASQREFETAVNRRPGVGKTSDAAVCAQSCVAALQALCGLWLRTAGDQPVFFQETTMAADRRRLEVPGVYKVRFASLD